MSSLFALGYHERVASATSTPAYLKDIRRTAFARAYSADKNVSIFLGRPPRMHQRYCRFQLPGSEHDGMVERWKERVTWKGNEEYSYTTDTTWSAVCAYLKEQILDLMQDENVEERSPRAL